MKIVVASGHDAAYAPLAGITWPVVRKYCERHGYGPLYDPDRNDKDACKVAMFQRAYASGIFCPDDIFCWIDTDAVIMNHALRIEQIVYWLMPRSVHFLIGTDPNGLNSGVFFARFSEEANLFMTVANNQSVISGWADQEGYIQTAVKEPHKSIYREVPGKIFNCNLYELKGWDFGEYGNYLNRYESGDFILHLAGIDEPVRSETLRKYAALAV